MLYWVVTHHETIRKWPSVSTIELVGTYCLLKSTAGYTTKVLLINGLHNTYIKTKITTSSIIFILKSRFWMVGLIASCPMLLVSSVMCLDIVGLCFGAGPDSDGNIYKVHVTIVATRTCWNLLSFNHLTIYLLHTYLTVPWFQDNSFGTLASRIST